MTRLLLDADGVLLDFVHGFLKAVVAAGGPVLNHDDFPTWDVFSTLQKKLEEVETPAEVARIMEEVNAATRRRGFCLELPPLPGAAEALKQIQKAKHIDFFIITSHFGGNETWVHERDTALMKHFGIPTKKIMHGSSKHIVTGDIFVDDKFENVAAWVDHNPQGAGFLWDTPHNRVLEKGAFKGRAMQRVESWLELLDILRIP